MSTGAATEPSATATSDHALHRRERPREHGVGHGALQQRVSGDVHDRVADADERKGDEGDPGLGPQADEQERTPQSNRPTPKSVPSFERATSSAAATPPDDSADPEGRVEQAHARRAQVERLDGKHDDEDTERAVDERL